MGTGQDVSLQVGFCGTCLSRSCGLTCSFWGVPEVHCALVRVSHPIPFLQNFVCSVA